MKKIEVVLGRDSLHYVVERLALIDHIKSIHVTSSELVNLHAKEEDSRSLISIKIEFVIEDEYVDEVLQLLLGDDKITFGRIYVLAVDRLFELGYREGYRFRLALSSLIRASRSDVFSTVTDYENLVELFPSYFKGINIRSSSDNVTVTEEEVMLDNLSIKQISRHITYPPAVHEVEILSGYLEGSRITETYTEVSEGTQLMVVADIRIKEPLARVFGFHIRHKVEQQIRSLMKELARIMESRYEN
ncbi:MAG: SRPBCC family protein [Candidatus Nitrosocaldus sp.]|nr:SRPBCC family protein [Candidatus Nitrosocaldus sp.]MDW8000954.1 SRPBCC family protein [Candidatus Nitrosocaldus sp.]